MYAESICYYYYDFRRFINNVTNKTANMIENGRSLKLRQMQQEFHFNQVLPQYQTTNEQRPGSQPGSCWEGWEWAERGECREERDR
jgi:hypothetical protein